MASSETLSAVRPGPFMPLRVSQSPAVPGPERRGSDAVRESGLLSFFFNKSLLSIVCQAMGGAEIKLSAKWTKIPALMELAHILVLCMHIWCFLRVMVVLSH